MSIYQEQHENDLVDCNDHINERNLTGFCILTAIFCSSLIINMVVASKVISIFGLFLPASVFIWALTYPCSDIVAEVYGRKFAHKMVLGGFIAYAMAIAMVKLAVVVTPAPFWEKQEAFSLILNSSLRIAFASIVSYGVTQFFDVHIFGYIRKKTRGKHLWLRNNLSTIMSQTMANIIFLILAFWGTMPLENWLSLFSNNLMVRYLLALSDTALVYAGVYALYKFYPELNPFTRQVKSATTKA